MPNSNSLWIVRLKLALIPALALILLVLMWPAPNSEPQTTIVASARDRTPLKTVAATNSQRFALEADWGAIHTAYAGIHNPFAPVEIVTNPPIREASPLSTSSPPALSESSAGKEPNAATLKVQAIHGISGAYCALVDGRLLQVGDQLADGRRIAAVTAEGIVLEPN
jgi:hypothetical protein